LIGRVSQIGLCLGDLGFVHGALLGPRLMIEAVQVRFRRLDCRLTHEQLGLERPIVQPKQRRSADHPIAVALGALHDVAYLGHHLDHHARHVGADADVLGFGFDDPCPCDRRAKGRLGWSNRRRQPLGWLTLAEHEHDRERQKPDGAHR